MKRMDLKHKFFAFAAVVVSFMIFATPILADEFAAGRMAGLQDAIANVNGNLWLLFGCTTVFFGGSVVGLIPIIMAYIHEPTPPTAPLLGKPPTYVAAYKGVYKVAAQKIQTNNVTTGYVFGATAFWILFFYVIGRESFAT